MKRFALLSILLAMTACESANLESAKLENALHDDSIDHILTVRHIWRSSAIARIYSIHGDHHRCESTSLAYVGRNGIGKTREGDGKTPTGQFKALRAFGIQTDPGAHIGYLHIDENTIACDQNCEFYNTIVDSTIHKCGGEHMIDYPLEYAYGFELDYNPENVFPLGSAIFLHCKGSRPMTAGCIAIDSSKVRKLIQEVQQGLLIIIY